MDSLPAKTCTKCGERKLLTEYSKTRASKDGMKASCKLCDSIAACNYYQANKSSIALKNKKYSEENLESIATYRRSYREDNRNRKLEQDRIYRENNRNKIQAASRDFYRRNKDLYIQKSRAARARKKKSSHEYYTEQQVLDQYGTACHLCTKEVNLEAPRWVGVPGWEDGLHIDHVLPISKGGPDTLDNVRPAHGSCNLKKGDRI